MRQNNLNINKIVKKSQALLNSLPLKLANLIDRVDGVSSIPCRSMLFIFCNLKRASFIFPILERIAESIALKSFRCPSEVFASLEFFLCINSGL